MSMIRVESMLMPAVHAAARGHDEVMLLLAVMGKEACVEVVSTTDSHWEWETLKSSATASLPPPKKKQFRQEVSEKSA